jgi:two-component system chemotaxis response regulator CheB
MPLRVLIAAEPSLGDALARALQPPDFQRLGLVVDARDLLARCREQRPDLVLLQVALALRDLNACVADVMAYAPTPILMVAGPGEGPGQAFSALASGALDAVAFHPDQPPAELVRRAQLLAGVRVITHVRAKHAQRPRADPQTRRVVGIAASLGGPRALASLLHDLKPPLPVPLLIVQHISDGFTEGLAHWLAAETGVAVHEARDGEPLDPGLIVVAPSRQHLEVRDGIVRLTDGLHDGGFRPSCSMLFRSMAQYYGSRGIGVVLTGMGSDGAEGLLQLRQRGGRTLAQDEASCVVFGMPKAAWELGAVEQLVPLEGMAAALRRLLDS